MPAAFRSVVWTLPLLLPAFFFVAGASGCDDSEMSVPALPSGRCDSDRTPCTYTHDFGITQIPGGEERTNQCYTYRLDNPNDVWVNSVQLDNDGAFHHSNWFFVPEKMFETDKVYAPCKELNFTELSAALTGGVLFAQSTQSRTETQKFASGAAVRVPAWSRIITSAHLLNAAPAQLSTGLRLKIQTVPPEQVKVTLAPFRLSYTDLHIPPMQHSEFIGDCNVRASYEPVVGEQYAMKLYYVLPHFHDLGEMFNLQITGGPEAGKVIYDLHDTIGEAHGQAFDPPLNLDASNGFRFNCGYHNPRNQEVKWGDGDQEMCVMLGFADAKVRFDAVVNKDKDVSDRMGVSVHTGPCNVVVYRFDK